MQIHRDRCNFRDLPIYCVSMYMTKTYEYTWTVPLTCYSSVSIWTKWIYILLNWRIGLLVSDQIWLDLSANFDVRLRFYDSIFAYFFSPSANALAIVRLRYVAIICNVILIYTRLHVHGVDLYMIRSDRFHIIPYPFESIWNRTTIWGQMSRRVAIKYHKYFSWGFD